MDLVSPKELTINIRMQPSKVFEVEEQEEQPDEEGEEEKQKYKFTFDWHCKEGITANIQKLRVEFNQKNQLEANRIFLQGPPASGKTYFGA